MPFLWDQLAASEPIIKTQSEAKIINSHHERVHLHKFLMGINMNELVREDIRLQSLHFPQIPLRTNSSCYSSLYHYCCYSPCSISCLYLVQDNDN